MDADYEENGNDPNEFSGRKRKGRSRFGHVVAQKKPVFNPGVLICIEYTYAVWYTSSIKICFSYFICPFN